MSKTIYEFVADIASKRSKLSSGGIRLEDARRMIGRTIKPPKNEEDLYDPKKLTITDVEFVTKGSGTKIKFETNTGLCKKELDLFGTVDTVVVFETCFFSGRDPDSIWAKWLVDEDVGKVQVLLTKTQIARVNGTMGATNCISCNKKLVPMIGTVNWCPDCEKD